MSTLPVQMPVHALPAVRGIDRGSVAALLLSAVAMFAGCAGAGAQADSDGVEADQLRVEEDGFSFLRGGIVATTVDAGGTIEALGTDGSLVVWQIDDGSGRLLVRPATSREAKTTSVAAEVEAEAICLAAIDAEHYDLFLADGDGALHHYWLTTGGQPVLRLVRTLHTNPDVTHCALDAERLYVGNPPIGIVSFARDPETDPVMELVYAAGTAGAGRIEPAAFRLDESGLHARLIVWNDQGQAFAVDPSDPSDPQAAEPIDASSTTIPLAALKARAVSLDHPGVVADVETDPVPSTGDAADDPAILVGESGTVWIVGTNKRKGLHVYDLAGRELHQISRGRINNVDALALSDGRHLLAASNRTHRTLDLFRANVERNQIEFASALPLDLDDPYGLCMGRRPDGSVAVFVGGTDGAKQVWRIDADTLDGELVGRFDFDSQTEGCVYDATADELYVGEEKRGVWIVDLESGDRRLFESVDAGRLVPDVEGLDIYRRGDASWLVASSQGDDSFVVYPLTPGGDPRKFRIRPDYAGGVDGVSETDGLAVSSAAMPRFPSGILVVQDGRNRQPPEAQNFKIVDWRRIEALLESR